jgi:hypothetical protein
VAARAPLETLQQRTDAAMVHASAAWADSIGWAPAIAGIDYAEPSSDEDRTAALWNAEKQRLTLVPVRIGDDPEHWTLIVMHELGHALGLEHRDAEPALMNTIPMGDACVRQSDAEQVWSRLGIVARVTCH